jgi:hypothetical protein
MKVAPNDPIYRQIFSHFSNFRRYFFGFYSDFSVHRKMNKAKQKSFSFLPGRTINLKRPIINPIGARPVAHLGVPVTFFPQSHAPAHVSTIVVLAHWLPSQPSPCAPFCAEPPSRARPPLPLPHPPDWPLPWCHPRLHGQARSRQKPILTGSIPKPAPPAQPLIVHCLPHSTARHWSPPQRPTLHACPGVPTTVPPPHPLVCASS